jgi:LmbE family N-acetylglucosaminyl deacetylase
MTINAAVGSALLERVDVASLPTLHVPDRRTLVVVPHPDDECLATGGLIARQRSRGLEVVTVAVSDGEAAYEHWNGESLAAVRRHEQTSALRSLAADEPLRLGLPDGAVGEHVGRLIDELERLVRPGDLLVSPCVDDWHPDHVACALAARAVSSDNPRVIWWGSMFWMHHFPRSCRRRSARPKRKPFESMADAGR